MSARLGAKAEAPKLPRYVEMIRVSTMAQADRETPEDQRAALDRLRTVRPGTLVERIDEAVSGAKDASTRADLKRLFELAGEGAFDEVRVRHIDRLTRHDDPRERFAVYGAIRDAHAVIVEASGRVVDPADEMGELDLTLQGWFASRERKRILERTQTAKKRKASEGRLAQGQPPFGRTFDKVTGQWGIDPERAATYRRMFDLCLAGKSLSEIAAILNAEGKVSTRGKQWTGSNVCKLLREPAAFGRYSSQGHTFTIPAVVDEATFRATDAKLKANNTLGGPRPTVFALLRKVAVCGECGAPMYIQLGGGTPSRIRYYHCAARDPGHRFYLRVDETDARVTASLKRVFSDPHFLRKAAEADEPKSQRHSAERAIAEARREIAAAGDREERLARLLTKGLISERTGERQLEEIRGVRVAAEARIETAKAALAEADQQASARVTLVETIALIREGIADSTPEHWRATVEDVFGRGGIKLFRDGHMDFSGALWARPRNASPASGRR